MQKLFNEWLFTGVTASSVLMSVSTLQPGHALAILARSLGYGLALLCIFAAAMMLLRRWRRARERR